MMLIKEESLKKLSCVLISASRKRLTQEQHFWARKQAFTESELSRCAVLQSHQIESCKQNPNISPRASYSSLRKLQGLSSDLSAHKIKAACIPNSKFSRSSAKKFKEKKKEEGNEWLRWWRRFRRRWLPSRESRRRRPAPIRFVRLLRTTTRTLHCHRLLVNVQSTTARSCIATGSSPLVRLNFKSLPKIGV